MVSPQPDMLMYLNTMEKKNTDLYAWISISSYLKTSSKLVEFSDDRLKNIFNVSNQIFKLFLKDFT